jgi:CDGSH-type Zn-finger protein
MAASSVFNNCIMSGEIEMKKEKPRIICRPDGPYHLPNDSASRIIPEIRKSNGESYPETPGMALCRCGGSGKKPFCDGTHKKIGFSDAKQTDGALDKRLNYAGGKITIHDNRGICAHAGHCTDNLASVFKLNKEPWIDPDGASAQEIMETIKKCPSGALSYTVDGVEHRDQDRKPMITITKNGPYAVTGDIELADQPRGEEASSEHYALCRCGGSKNKPFCDGTHWHIGFEDEKN